MVMELILEFLGLAVDKVTITTKTWLRRLIWSLVAALILFGIGWASAVTFLLKAGIILLLAIVIGIVAVILLAAAAVKIPAKGITGSTKEFIEAFAGFLFWLLSLLVLLMIFPIWNNPGVILLLLVLSLIFALGYARFGIGLNPRWAASRNTVIFISVIVIAVATAAVPELKTIVKKRLISLAETLGETIAKPEKIEYSLANIYELEFFKSVGGKPKVFYEQLENGSYVLYDGEGFSPNTGTQLQSATPDLKQKIKAYLEAKAKEKEEKEARLKEETELREKVSLKDEQTKIPPQLLVGAELENGKKIKSAEEEKKDIFQPPALITPPEIETPKESVTSVINNTQSPEVKLEVKSKVNEVNRETKIVKELPNTIRIQKILIPEGTVITVRTTMTVGSDRSRAGDTFLAVLDEKLAVNGVVALDVGSQTSLWVTYVKQAGRVEGKSLIELIMKSISTEFGPVEVLATKISFEAEPSKKSDIFKTAILGAAGTAIGAIIDGKKGAVIGGSAGAGSGILLRGSSIVIPSETRLEFRLQKSIIIEKRP